MRLVIGLDFGTDSVRALVADALSGAVAGECVAPYPRWGRGEYCDPGAQVFRQHPLDYMESMTLAVRGALDGLSAEDRARVAAIGFDATGATVCPVDRDGTPLSLLEGFEDNPDAMFHLWKDHSALEEAADIHRAFLAWPERDYTRYQGEYSAEWFWSKALHAARKDPSVRDAAYSWVELTDWAPALLCGRTDPATMYRCFSSAGHKALWHSALGGLPSGECLRTIDPYLAEVAARYAPRPGLSTDRVGMLSAEWKERLGLSGDVVVGGSSLDAHAGAVGAGIRPGMLVKVIGTSSVDLAAVREEDLPDRNLSHLFGLAQNAILPGFLGLESGQCAFGDVFAWLRGLLGWVLDDSDAVALEIRAALNEGMLSRLEA
ncbi:MAG TPA: ribulokinase, partial [Candidatus Limnocylindria bacterium]|nr:ribulokinase [Candidatus Limnocylindria bacterium]